MHDAFDFAQLETTLKSIKPESEQARILSLMLEDVCSCCDFIQSYAKDAQFCMWSQLDFGKRQCKRAFLGKRTLRNIGGGPEEEIKKLSNVLFTRRNEFLGQATISTEITAFQILDDVAKISSQLSFAGR
jgi:hypothetical protein